jgi:hypothetical protein
MNTFQILTSKFQFNLMHWNVCIGPEKWPIFGRFQTLFPLKSPAQREKNTSNMAVTIGDVMDDVTCKSSSVSSRISKGQGYQGFIRKRAGCSFGQKRAICRTRKNRQNFTTFRVNQMFSLKF